MILEGGKRTQAMHTSLFVVVAGVLLFLLPASMAYSITDTCPAVNAEAQEHEAFADNGDAGEHNDNSIVASHTLPPADLRQASPPAISFGFSTLETLSLQRARAPPRR
jgi:hypothetical protein